MAHPTWRDEVSRWITSSLEEGKRRGLEGKALEKFVRENGKGGIWAGGSWALKIWRQEFKIIVKGVERPSPARRGPRRPGAAQGQLDLF